MCNNGCNNDCWCPGFSPAPVNQFPIPGPRGPAGPQGPPGTSVTPINASFIGNTEQIGLEFEDAVEFTTTFISTPSITLGANAFTFTQTGIYLVSFSIVVDNITGGFVSFLLSNGTDISNPIHAYAGTAEVVCTGTVMLNVTTLAPFSLISANDLTTCDVLAVSRSITFTKVG